VRCLVDTHYLLWTLMDPSRIGSRAAEILSDPDTTKCASKVSFWEIALKYSIGKLRLERTTPEGVLAAARESGFEIADISEDDIASSYRLPFLADHRDPFDRLLVWQCIRTGMPMLSADVRLKGYAPHGLQLAV
jgi:PIN domain nuclease of toxin-antitoxin system